MNKQELKGASHLRIDNDILRSKAFGQFALTKEAAIWFHLSGWIIRGQMSSCGLGKKLYEDFYLGQRKLVARWDQEMIAEAITENDVKELTIDILPISSARMNKI